MLLVENNRRHESGHRLQRMAMAVESVVAIQPIDGQTADAGSSHVRGVESCHVQRRVWLDDVIIDVTAPVGLSTLPFPPKPVGKLHVNPFWSLTDLLLRTILYQPPLSYLK